MESWKADEKQIDEVKSEDEVESEERRCNSAKVRRKSFEVKMLNNWEFGPLLEVTMSKNCTPLWQEAHFQVKMYKTRQLRTIFWSSDVEKLRATVARSTLPSQNVKKLTVSQHFLKFRCRKISQLVN